jgi:hypothetical protein
MRVPRLTARDLNLSCAAPAFHYHASFGEESRSRQNAENIAERFCAITV